LCAALEIAAGARRPAPPPRVPRVPRKHVARASPDRASGSMEILDVSAFHDWTREDHQFLTYSSRSMLTGPTPSGSADAPRLCRGCSHPHRHLPARAAPSFHRLLRQPTGAGLSPPLKQQRLTAHEASPERLRNHVPRPHPDKMITDQIRSTVYLIDPGVTDTSASGVRAALVRVVCAGPGAAVGRFGGRLKS
jgi:hypothetical protein